MTPCYGGDAVVSAATGLSRVTIRKGRREVEDGVETTRRVRRIGAGRPGIDKAQPGVRAALERLVDPLTRGDPTSPLRWTCKSRAKLAATLSNDGWSVSSTTVGRLLHELGYSLFCHITQNWGGKPLRTFETLVDLIGNTRTAAGLRVKANLDSRKYRTGVEITKAQMSGLALYPHEFHGEWNCELQPRELNS